MPWLLASLAVHAAALGVFASLTSFGGGRGGNPLGEHRLVAKLTTPVQRFVVPRAEPAEIAPSTDKPAATLGPAAALPVPLKAKRQRPAPGVAEGVATVLMLDDATPADPALGKALQAIHPDAMRLTADFVVPPAPIYPAGALAERRQLQQDVIVVVREDGAVAPLEGSLGDSMFDAAIRLALAQARAEPPIVDGQPRLGWALLRFAFEFVGVRP